MEQTAFTPMPKEIAGAVVLVMRAVGKLVRDGRNQHGGYKYASTDAFFEAINPACAEAGLIIKPRVLHSEIINVDVWDKDTKSMKPKRMLSSLYGFMLIHESGATWIDPDDKRPVTLDYTGPQSYGASESYAEKGYMRTLFIVATGDKDADAQEQHSAEIIRATVKAVKAKKETGEEQVMIDFGQGIETVSVADVSDRVLAHLKAFDLQSEARQWWDDQKTGREQFYEKSPRLALELKRSVEAFFEAEAA